MNKTNLLLQMMEQPQHYTVEEWQEILADEECRELYTLMSKTQSAIDAVRAGQEVSDDMIDAEWQRLSHEKQEVRSEKHSILKFAAMFVGILMLSGIAFAAIHIVRQYQKPEVPMVADTVTEVNSSLPTLRSSLPADTIAKAEPVVFVNVTLDSIAKDIATYHHLDMDFQNNQAYQLRFYFVWNQEDSLQEVIEKLNMFEQVNLAVEDGKLMVR
jgi:hypothetical protein